MKIKSIGCMALATMLALMAGCQTTPDSTIQPIRWTYDFSFVIEGDAMAKPMQAFTDGKSTFMTFRSTQPVGEITNGKGEPLQTQIQGSYLVIKAVLPEIKINLGNQYFAKVTYNRPTINAPTEKPVQAALPTAAAVESPVTPLPSPSTVTSSAP